jgi:hypothetical protein
MKSMVRLLDRFLARMLGLSEYWDDPTSILRIRVVEAPHTLCLSDVEIEAGATVVELHFWNDHIPPLPTEGPDLAWAMGFYRMLVSSFRVLAGQLATRPDLAAAQALGGATVLVVPGGRSASEKLFERLGLELFPYHNPLGRFGIFWENLFTWALMWAYNGVSVRQRHVLELHRTEAWMSRDKFLRRHGGTG